MTGEKVYLWSAALGLSLYQSSSLHRVSRREGLKVMLWNGPWGPFASRRRAFSLRQQRTAAAQRHAAAAAALTKDASDFNEKKFDHHQASSRQLDSFSLGMLNGKVLLEINLCFASFTKTSQERLSASRRPENLTNLAKISKVQTYQLVATT